MRKIVGVILVTAALIIGAAPPASAWSWSETQTYRAGSANVGGSSSGGGILRWNGFDYIPGAGHVNSTLGMSQWDRTPDGVTSRGHLGHVSHSTQNTRKVYASTPDVGLIATGTDPIAPVIRVSAGWTNASIEAYAAGTAGALPAGRTLCQSGFHWATRNNGGYRCGTLYTACDGTQGTCSLVNSGGVVGAGDSGGPVWDYYNGGVVLVGWIVQAGGSYLPGNESYTAATFVPIWTLARHAWRAGEETWQTTRMPVPTGRTTGCFVTRTGCQTVS